MRAALLNRMTSRTICERLQTLCATSCFHPCLQVSSTQAVKPKLPPPPPPPRQATCTRTAWGMGTWATGTACARGTAPTAVAARTVTATATARVARAAAEAPPADKAADAPRATRTTRIQQGNAIEIGNGKEIATSTTRWEKLGQRGPDLGRGVWYASAGLTLPSQVHVHLGTWNVVVPENSCSLPSVEARRRDDAV